MLAGELDWAGFEEAGGYRECIFLGHEARNCYAGLDIVEPGGGVEPHRHPEGEQIYIVLDGEARISVDGEDRQVRKGMFVYIPPGAEHSVRNDLREPFRYVFVSTWPFRRERLFRPCQS